jgi:hypothetical protein
MRSRARISAAAVRADAACRRAGFPFTPETPTRVHAPGDGFQSPEKAQGFRASPGSPRPHRRTSPSDLDLVSGCLDASWNDISAQVVDETRFTEPGSLHREVGYLICMTKQKVLHRGSKGSKLAVQQAGGKERVMRRCVGFSGGAVASPSSRLVVVFWECPVFTSPAQRSGDYLRRQSVPCSAGACPQARSAQGTP